MPRWMVPTLLIATVVAVVPAALIMRARSDTQKTPRINLVPDMDYQPRYMPQTANSMFRDGRAMRQFPDGTVARGMLQDEHHDRGRTGGDWATTFPMPVTESVMQRGRQRFEIFCSPCHGLDGMGRGLVALRADRLMELGEATWTPPLSLHDPAVRERPVGHIFNTISFGIRSMPSYGAQIAPADRWAIVAYVRALQRSTAATMDDVPASERGSLQGGTQ